MSSLFKKESKKGLDYIRQKYGVDVPELSSYSDCLDCLFSIRDVVCEEYNPPFVSRNMKTAIRSIKESLKGQQSLISMHPEDYILEHVGYFDKTLGTVVPTDYSNREVYPLSRLFISDVNEVKKQEGKDNEISQ